MNRNTNRSAIVVAIFAVIGIFSAGYLIGFRSERSARRGGEFRVAGDSMAPTLVDGDVCRLEPLGGPLKIGDVVAAEWGGKRRLKRVAAITGDTVDAAQGRLTINGRRLEDLLADRFDELAIPPALVPVASSSRNWKPVTDEDDACGQWIRFTYMNPHEGDRATAVPDDYPTNRSLRRRLYPVDRLVVRVPEGFRVAFHDDASTVRLITASDKEAHFRDATKANEETVPVPDCLNDALDEAHPIAIDIGTDRIVDDAIEVFREIEYRDDGRSADVSYPITLNDDEVFLLGDNTPISIDSRDVGPIKTSAILGRAQPFDQND